MDRSKKEDVLTFAQRVLNKFKLEFLRPDGPKEIPLTVEARAADHGRAIDQLVAANRMKFGSILDGVIAKRKDRTLEAEIQSIWQLAFNSYGNFVLSVTPERIKEELGASREMVMVLQAEAVAFLKAHILPKLSQLPNPGDATYWLAIDAVLHAPSKEVAKAITDLKQTPANSYLIYYGMFGLLLQAEQHLKQGQRVEAHSCLLDAQMALGLTAGARSITNLFGEAAASRAGVVRGRGKHDKDDFCKLLLIDLYYELQEQADGSKKPWGSAEEAAYAMQDSAMKQFEYSVPPDKGVFSFEQILIVSAKLFKLDAQGSTLDIQATAVREDESHR